MNNQATQNPELLIADEDHVRILTLNRPERSNALSRKLMQSLSEALIEADELDAVRVVVLTGAGERSFCSGADLKDLRQQDEEGVQFRSPMARVERPAFEIAAEMKKPTIAALNGSAVAGGFELALACDLRIAHPECKVGLPEAKIGMGANFGSVVLPRRVPLCFALELLYTGEYIAAQRAYELGLLNRLVAKESVLPESVDLAKRIARNAPLSVRRMKALALKGLDMPLASALRLDIGPNPYLSEDRKEGITARLEKRDPVWRGR